MDVSLSELRELVMDREAWRAVIHGVTKSRTRLNDWTELNWTEHTESWDLGETWSFLPPVSSFYRKLKSSRLSVLLKYIQPERSTAKATQQDNPVPSVLLSMTLHTTRSKCLNSLKLLSTNWCGAENRNSQTWETPHCPSPYTANGLPLSYTLSAKRWN